MKLWMYIVLALAAVVVTYMILAAQNKKRQMELMALSQNTTNGVVTNANTSGNSAGNTILDWVIALTPLAIAGGTIAAQAGAFGGSGNADDANPT